MEKLTVLWWRAYYLFWNWLFVLAVKRLFRIVVFFRTESDQPVVILANREAELNTTVRDYVNRLDAEGGIQWTEEEGETNE